MFSARRAVIGGKKLDGSQFIMSTESTTDRFPPVSSPSAQIDSEHGHSANTINLSAPTPSL